MTLGKLTELRLFLTQHKLLPKRSSSQNFLIDENIINKLISSASITSNDIVLEVGPGPGAITEALVKKARLVIAVEKDFHLAKLLQERLPNAVNLTVVNSDFLNYDVTAELNNNFSQNQSFKIVGNLPFHIMTKIFEKLFGYVEWIDQITVIIQRDAAERFLAKPKDKRYSVFSVALQSLSKTMKIVGKVSKQAFFPKPNVECVIFHVPITETFSSEEFAQFFTFLKSAFQNKRKTLVNNLKNSVPTEKLLDWIHKVSLSDKIRADGLSSEKLLDLFRHLNQ